MLQRVRFPFQYGWDWAEPTTDFSMTATCKPTWPLFGDHSPLWARIHVSLNAFAGYSQTAVVLLDVLFSVEDIDEREPIRRLLLPLPWHVLYHLFVAGLASITSSDVSGQLSKDRVTWLPNVSCHIVLGTAKWLNFDDPTLTFASFPPKVDTRYLLEETFQQEYDAHRVAREWVYRLLLKVGCLNAEKTVEALD